MNRKETSVITTVLFFGIILSCTIFFGITSFLGFYDSGEFYFDIERFDRDFYNNEDLAHVVTYCDYKLFGCVKNKNIIVGYDKFLFEIEKNGYNFIEDYVGNACFTESEIQTILENLTLRKKKYEDMGIEYMIAFIPNSQSVYSEKMPFYFGELSNNTRLLQVERCLKENGTLDFVDPTSMLLRIKNSYPVYNNTDNTMNLLGAYYLYKGVFRALPLSSVREDAFIENHIGSITLHYTDGRDLARSAGVDSIVKNRTLSIQTDVPYMYETVIERVGTETTYVKPGYQEEFYSPQTIMIEYLNDWDKLLLTPYFSNTFETVIYKKNYVYDRDLLNDNSVSAVIQIVREYELDTFLDEDIASSYR